MLRILYGRPKQNIPFSSDKLWENAGAKQMSFHTEFFVLFSVLVMADNFLFFVTLEHFLVRILWVVWLEIDRKVSSYVRGGWWAGVFSKFFFEHFQEIVSFRGQSPTRMQERQNAIIILRCFHTEKSCTFRQYFISFIAAIKGQKIDFKLEMFVRTVRNEEGVISPNFFQIILIKLV